MSSSSASQKLKVVVFGAGSFGTSLAYRLALANPTADICILARSEQVAKSINVDQRNSNYLKTAVYKLPSIVRASTDPIEAKTADYILHTVPTQSSFHYLRSMAPFIPSSAILISASKGICTQTLQLMCQIIPTALKSNAHHKPRMAFISGPSFAKELVENVPTAVVVASAERELAVRVQSLFLHPLLRVYVTSDVVGVEVGGALKNVYAIAAGCVDAMNLGLNTMAALVTRANHELATIATALGARYETLAGLSGIGDLILTSYGPLSRNRTVGERLGRGETLEDIRRTTNEVAEGVATTFAAVELCKLLNVEAPICSAVKALLTGEEKAAKVVEGLMRRPVDLENAVTRSTEQWLPTQVLIVRKVDEEVEVEEEEKKLEGMIAAKTTTTTTTTSSAANSNRGFEEGEEVDEDVEVNIAKKRKLFEATIDDQFFH